MSATYSFIDNVNDFFSTGYFTVDFQKKVFDRSGHSAEGIKQLTARFGMLRQQYNRYKQEVTSRYAREKDKAASTHQFNSKLLTCLAYTDVERDEPATILSLPLGEGGKATEVSVRTVCSRADGSPQLYVMDIETLVSADNTEEAQTGFAELGLDRMVTHIFSLPEREHPRYLLLLGGSKVFFMDADKWERGAYLQFDIERLLVETTQSAMRNYFALFYLLVSHEALASPSDTPLMQQLEEESYKNAYAVTQDLKRGVVNAVEALANEAIWYIKHTPENEFHAQDETDDHFEAMMRDDCLVYIYRLLFVFYAESRPDLDILPINDQTYQRGYSLEMLRDLEQVNLITEEERSGYFFDRSIKQLFTLILRGYNEDCVDASSMTASFRVRHIDSPLFSDQRLQVLRGVRFRNEVWQRIVCELSLSQQQRGKMRGRISYANLGINQLGSVYENLLAYRGFYAEEDFIEVHPVGDTVETYLVPRSRRDDFKEDEILKDAEGRDVIHPKGNFIYRLNGRDRKKSASYYTPEVLTKSTVKYTLKGFVERLESGDMKASDLLQLKILEPAMGAAAFQNEVINQLAVLYLNYRKREVAEAIDPLLYPQELQKVKAFIATNNVYGVDLNATAIELGKLSLWLNVMHRDMEVPFFSNRLAQGNAVIGAWLKVYKQSDVVRTVVGRKAIDTKWWEAPTRRISFSDTHPLRHYTEVYHFLLPVKEMLGVLSTGQKKRTDPEYRHMVEVRKGWLKGITANEYEQLKRISRKIDVLLKDYVQFQMSVAEYANNGYAVWQYAGKRTLPFDTNHQREEFDDLRYRKNSPYMKLKMVMDYWCALFFWEFSDALSLPTRQEYWNDIERLLDVDVREEATVRFSNADRTGQEDLFRPKQGALLFDDKEEESAVKAKAVTEILSEMGGKQTDKLQLEGIVTNDRFQIVERLAERYHFFHPMLEFLEVFWLRDGFDIICGNPPWIKLEFNEASIIAEKYPEVAIRRTSAPEVRQKLAAFTSDDAMNQLYLSEQNEQTCSTAFLNAYCNYPLLVGQQTNLYKCVLTNSFDLVCPKGFVGMLHPDSVYDDAHGQVLRKAIYGRLKYHFQYVNVLHLFKEILHWVKYSTNVYKGSSSTVNFKSINNLYTPSTIDECFINSSSQYTLGLKDEDGNWNTKGQSKRIVTFHETDIKVLSHIFEDGTTEDCAKLVCMQTQEILNVLSTISKYPSHLNDASNLVTECFHETGAVDEGIIQDCSSYEDINRLIFKGPYLYVSNPFFQNPHHVYRNHSDYDTIDLCKIKDSFCPRTLFVPKVKQEVYEKQIKGFPCGTDSNGRTVYENWIDYYKVGFRKMVSLTGERSLICAVLPRRTAHIHGVISISFLNRYDSVDMAALCASIVMDFYVKTIGSTNLQSSRMQSFPLGVPSKYQFALYSRTLLLNCLTTHYADLWQSCWREDYAKESWSVDDARLKPFSGLTEEWKWETPLRNYFERRMALVEIDVLAAMALGLSLDDLETIYTIQFPVLQQNENDTWYDARGNIVFTCSKGLTGVGLDRPTWNAMRGEQLDDNTFAGAASTYTHTIDPKKSELYGGQQVEYAAPYTRCDRIADYRRAWAHFEKRFKSE